MVADLAPPLVVKFGGAVLRAPDGFRQMLQIVRTLAQAPSHHSVQPLSPPILVVVSAFASTTRNLEGMAREAMMGQGAQAGAHLEEMLELHRGLVLDLLESGSEREALLALIDSVAVEVRQLLEGIGITRQLTARTLDRVMAYGELLALHIARHVLANGGVDTAWTDARRLVVTDEMFGAASPLPDKTRVHVQATLRPLLAKHQCVLVQGFVGATEEGVVTTMGRESSTLTATLLAELLEAESVTLFTDVEGVRTADPHRFEHTSVHPRLSYDQAALAAGHGLKLLYATTMEPAKRAGIPVHIRSAQKPDGEHTEIGLQGAEPTPIVILAEGRVSVVLANQAKVLQAVGLLAAEVQGAESWHLVANPEEHAVELTVPPLSAEPIARRLHEWLNIRSSPSPNSRPADPTA